MCVKQSTCKEKPVKLQHFLFLTLLYLAIAAIFARVLAALVHNTDFTVASAKPYGAGASVVVPGVEARSAVVAWPVIGAKIQVLVAQQSAPSCKKTYENLLKKEKSTVTSYSITKTAKFFFINKM
jgi:hypothetical protein